MLEFIKGLLNLNVRLQAKAMSTQLMNEADALADAGEKKQALPLYEKAAELGEKHAMVRAGMIHLRGEGVPADWVRAATLLEMGMQLGVENVHLVLGSIYGMGGYGLKRNSEKALKHLQLALDQDGDQSAAKLIEMVRKKQSPFGGKEQARPKINW